MAKDLQFLPHCSNRSGGAKGMFLAGTPVYTIMLMGRWSSDAFMRYIRKQVISLSHGIAAKMLTYEQFYTVPDFVHTAADGDPRSRTNTNLATTTNVNGQHANMRRGLHPAFHLSHWSLPSCVRSTAGAGLPSHFFSCRHISVLGKGIRTSNY